jgi:uncharacterized Rossmann fold enzyme
VPHAHGDNRKKLERLMVRLRVKMEILASSHMDINNDVVRGHLSKPAQDSQNPIK